MNHVTLIHPFQVSKEQEKEFLDAWQAVHQYMQKQKGFVATTMHRALDENNLKAFSFVNVALWESAASFYAAVANDDFKLLAKGVLSFSCGPGLYEILDVH